MNKNVISNFFVTRSITNLKNKEVLKDQEYVIKNFRDFLFR